MNVVQAGLECIARQQIQCSKAFLVPFLGKFQDIPKIDTTLVTDAMMSHQTAFKLLDEEWTRHSENVGGLLGLIARLSGISETVWPRDMNPTAVLRTSTKVPGSSIRSPAGPIRAGTPWPNSFSKSCTCRCSVFRSGIGFFDALAIMS
jgi:hypothetical protein